MQLCAACSTGGQLAGSYLSEHLCASPGIQQGYVLGCGHDDRPRQGQALPQIDLCVPCACARQQGISSAGMQGKRTVRHSQLLPAWPHVRSQHTQRAPSRTQPGGMSTTSTSSAPQSVPSRNRSIALLTMGPRHTTGASSCSARCTQRHAHRGLGERWRGGGAAAAGRALVSTAQCCTGAADGPGRAVRCRQGAPMHHTFMKKPMDMHFTP